eukprot:m.1421529 g.1421529  ORF g.1421529 m.1421529 type:complete len:434 (+) comp25047_c0_seq32:333-1634(+)
MITGAEFSSISSMCESAAGEMIYVLQQRLVAASCPPSEIVTVLGRICITMTDLQFMNVFFQPQGLYGWAQTSALFERLCHAGPLELNESSFAKLFDLMMMGFKYQLMSATCPSHLLGITINHVRAMKQIVHSSAEAVQSLEAIERKVLDHYKSFSIGNWALSRHALLSFVQGKREKILPFLTSGVQDDSGRFRLHVPDRLARGTTPPGSVTLFHNGKAAKSHFFDYGIHFQSLALDRTDPGSCTGLGRNVYDAHRDAAHVLEGCGIAAGDVPVVTAAAPVWDSVSDPSTPPRPSPADVAGPIPSQPRHPTSGARDSEPGVGRGANPGLSVLSRLLGMSAVTAETSGSHRLRLSFGGPATDAPPRAPSRTSTTRSPVPAPTATTEQYRESSGLKAIMNSFEDIGGRGSNTPAPAAQSTSLLDMLDTLGVDEAPT